MKKSKFNIGDSKNIYEGYMEDTYWNGWCKTWFTKEVGDKMTEDSNDTMYYEERLDAFIAIDSGNYGHLSNGAKDLIDRILNHLKPDMTKEYEAKNITSILLGLDFEIYYGEDIKINGETLHLYDIGNSCWIWDEYDEENVCDWCGEEYEEGYLKNTDCGKLCDTCIAAIRSRGESITIKLED